MKKILHFTKSDIQTAGDYFDSTGCLACVAVRRTFNLPANADVHATARGVGFQIPGKAPKTFAFCGDGGDKISACYPFWQIFLRPDPKPFRITLRPIRPAKYGIGGWDKKELGILT